MLDQPSDPDLIARKQKLQHEIITVFCQLGPIGWAMPALELNASRDPGLSKVTLSARAFDFQGDGEAVGAPEALMQAAATFHALCSEGGEDWKKCLLTLTLGQDRKVLQVQWNFKYD